MRILKEHTKLVVIDIQEKLFPLIDNNEQLLKKCQTLIEGIKLLSVPTIVTEQYVKGLGKTIEPIAESLGQFEPIEKMTFSCMGEPNFNLKIEEHFIKNVLLCGIESHVCILQTAIDLLDAGHTPIVVADAVSSRNPYDKEIALQRFASEGIRVTTVESILFELCKISGTEQFKAISKLVK
ncbi:hydrolase [Salibacteraceae bacterium]|jgi:nicotinamidase-related amidase|nr:hydrolase [Crocinitomicaceae bacterium]MDC1204837.1 hydrolase [Salibacteraceae bacterium]|tara:strand:+ start:9419 stop:9961 length:543 start_codon:yes stop_codon:yes gene_type:complete